jgi:predicted dehydrogenase
VIEKTLRVGMLGFGAMGKTHAFGYRTMPLYYQDLPVRIKLRGVCTARSDVSGLALEQLGFEYATHRPEDILEDPNIDIVHICTPNCFHKEAVLQALRNRKHVYCDKPIAANAGDAMEMALAARDVPVTAQMCMNYRFLPATLRAKELAEEGFLGDITCFWAAYRHSGSVDPDRPMGWKQDARMGGGVVRDLGSHALDLLYHLMGEFASVRADTRVLYPRRPDGCGGVVPVMSEDHAVMTVRMKNGALGTVEATKIATGANDELSFAIYGTLGAMEFHLMEPNWLYVFDNRTPESPLGGRRGFTRVECVQRYPAPGGNFPSGKAPIGWERGHVHCLYTFIDRVCRGLPGYPSLMDGAYIQRVMDSVLESAATGKEVALP